MNMDDPNKYRESAADRAHGTHGRGRTEESRVDEPVVDPGVERGLGERGWGSEASGGSSIDKRSPKERQSDDD
jgi:hypothetical protein